MVHMMKLLNFSVKFIIIFFSVVVFFFFSTLWYFSVGLPDYKKLSNYQPPISSRVYSKDNRLIAEYALEKDYLFRSTLFHKKLLIHSLPLKIKIFLVILGLMQKEY